MVEELNLQKATVDREASYRLIPSKFPPIALFDDVADKAEFEALFELQRRTNPRLLARAGNLGLIDPEQIPIGIQGCSYAVAPFTHVNPDGSRFSDGSFGVLYVANAMKTAVAEVSYHQQQYWQGVEGLAFDRFVFRGLRCAFKETLHEATELDRTHPVHDPNDYQVSQQWGCTLRHNGSAGLAYWSVRAPGEVCWALFSPRGVREVIQQAHYEMVWDGQQICSVNRLSQAT